MKYFLKIITLTFTLLYVNAVMAIECATWIAQNKTEYVDFRSTNAYQWYDFRDDKGFKSITKPEPGAVIVVNPHADNGNNGHVMYVNDIVYIKDSKNYTVRVSHANKYGEGNVFISDTISISNGLYAGKYRIRGIIKPKQIQLTVMAKSWGSTYLIKGKRSNFFVSLKNNGTQSVFPSELELVPTSGNSAERFSTHIDSLNPRILAGKTTHAIQVFVRPTQSSTCVKPKWNIKHRSSREVLGNIHFTQCIRVY